VRTKSIVWWLLGAVPSLGAQTTTADRVNSRFEVAAGITVDGPKDVNQRPLCTELGLPCLTPKTFPDFGILLQVAAYPVAHIALVGEASMYANLWDTVSTTTIADPRDNHIRALLAGPRLVSGLMHFGTKDAEGCRAFAQVLVGEERSAVVATRFAIQPGAGADFQLSNPNLWLRVTGDYRSTRGGPRNLSSGRAMAALVLAP
jgi:hypothetical protein